MPSHPIYFASACSVSQLLPFHLPYCQYLSQLNRTPWLIIFLSNKLHPPWFWTEWHTRQWQVTNVLEPQVMKMSIHNCPTRADYEEWWHVAGSFVKKFMHLHVYILNGTQSMPYDKWKCQKYSRRQTEPVRGSSQPCLLSLFKKTSMTRKQIT